MNSCGTTQIGQTAHLFHIRVIYASLVTGEDPVRYYSLPFALPSQVHSAQLSLPQFHHLRLSLKDRPCVLVLFNGLYAVGCIIRAPPRTVKRKIGYQSKKWFSQTNAFENRVFPLSSMFVFAPYRASLVRCSACSGFAFAVFRLAALTLQPSHPAALFVYGISPA